MAKTYVYIYRGDQAVPAGVLETAGAGREETARFTYGRKYLARRDRIALDPVQLPLHDPEEDREYATPEGFAMFNGLRDAAPDGWGRHLMDRAAGSYALTEFDYLAATGEDRVGALAFGPGLDGPRRVTPWNAARLDGEALDLAAMLTAAEAADAEGQLAPEHGRFLERGSSLGGARPKASTMIDGVTMIAKFGRNDDRYPICRIEHAAMTLAAQSGLNVPRTRLQRVLGKDVYLIERFDRVREEGGLRRIPFISGLTILGAHESESPRQSYRQLAEQLRLYGAAFRDDARELWRRMLFNILCSNTDDHLRNHGFLWDGRGWRLSPAYDIVPLPQMATEKDLAIGVGRDGRRATIKNALSEAAAFGLRPAEAREAALELQAFMRDNWRSVFRRSGLGDDLERVANCFSACAEKVA